MANKAVWVVDTAFTSALTTALNSLTNGSVSALSSAIANGTSLDMLMDIGLMLGSINPSGAPYVEIHAARLNGDGTTYDNVFAGGPTLIGLLGVSTGSSAKVGSLIGIQIPPGSFELAVVNQTGVTFAASANTLYYRLYSVNLNG